MSAYYSGSMFTDLIKAEIEKIPGEKKKGDKYTFILCPWHSEKTPSARVWHDNGYFKCYGCGHKAKWNDLAAQMRLQQFGKDAVKLSSQSVPKTDLDRFESLLDTKVSNDEDLQLYDLDSLSALEYAGLTARRWRGYDFDFLKKVGVKIALVKETGRYYMYLPINIRGKTRGYIKAQFKKPSSKKIPSYINSKGSWSLHSGLFPYDYAVQVMRDGGWKTLVLVEGPRDALRLLRFGIPAICIMGTHSWSVRKLRWLEFSGATRIILMFDGDAAGKLATRLIKTGLNQQKERITDPLSSLFNVKVVRLWEAEVSEDHPESKYDPGNCPVDILYQVQKLLR